MRKLWLGLLLVALAACADGPSPPVQPIPPEAPLSVPVLTADWSTVKEPFAVCTGSPFNCVGNAPWGLLPQNAGSFTPAGNELHYETAPNSGMALLNTVQLDKSRNLWIRLTVRVDAINCNQGVAYIGPVLYHSGKDDGDPTGRYRSIYISCFAGDTKVRLWLYSPTYAGPIWDFDFVPGSVHELGLDWYPGSKVNYWLDGAIVFTEGLSFGHDPLDIPADPYPAIWAGDSSGAVLSLSAGYLP